MKLQRTAKLETRGINAEARTVEMAISSELPYERIFGIEILDHAPDAVDLSRLSDNRHPLLLGHDWEKQIGVVQAPALGSDKVLRVNAKFSRATQAQEIFQDVQDEIRTLVSVGYEVLSIREEIKGADGETITRDISGDEFKREMMEKYGKDFDRDARFNRHGEEPPTYRVTRWVPYEASIVPIPADPTVGVGRAAGTAPAAPAEPEPHSAGTDANGRAAPETTAAPAAPAAPAIAITREEKRTMGPKDKTPAELEAARRDAIIALGEQYAKYIEQKDIFTALQQDRSVEQFKETIMQKMQSKHSDTSEMHIGMTSQDFKRYSLGRALQAAVTGDWKKAGFELECSRAVENLVGKSPEGFFVPFDVWRRDFNVGTSTEAGNLVATELRGDMFVDALRNNLVAGRLGIRILAGLTANVDLPRKATAGSLAMLTEIGSATETNPLTAKATLSPKRVGAFVEVSKQAIIQSAMSLEGMIRDDLLVGAAVLLESQFINGAGTGAEIRGIRNTTGIGTVAAGTNGAAPAWSHIVDLESACANANAEPDMVAGYLINTKTRGKLKQTQLGTNLPFIWQGSEQPLNSYRVGVTNNVPSNLTKGTSTTICSAAIFGSDWSMGVVGLFGAPDVVVDPYTKADTGQVKITLNQFADFAIRQPATFAKIEDLLSG